MAISRVTSQDASGGNTNAGTATISYPGATAANDLLIAAITSFGNAGQDASLSTSGWLKATSGGGSGSTQIHVAIYYKVADGTEASVTATNGGANSFGMGLSIFEYSGNATTSVTDGTPATNSSNGTGVQTKATPTITTTNATDLIFYVVGKGTIALGTVNWSTSLSVFGQQGSSALEVICGEDIVSSTQTNFSDTLTWSGSAQVVSSAIAAFQAGTVAPSSPVNFVAAPTVMVVR